MNIKINILPPLQKRERIVTFFRFTSRIFMRVLYKSTQYLLSYPPYYFYNTIPREDINDYYIHINLSLSISLSYILHNLLIYKTKPSFFVVIFSWNKILN